MASTMAMDNSLLTQQLEDDTLMGLRELDSHLELFDESLPKSSSDSISASFVEPLNTAHLSHTITVESPDARFPRIYQSEVGSHSKKSVFSSITQYVITPH